MLKTTINKLKTSLHAHIVTSVISIRKKVI